MLANDNKEIHKKAVLQVLAIMEIKSNKDICSESEESPHNNISTPDSFIHRFLILSINFEATCYYEVINNLSASTKKPPLTTNLSDNDIAKIQYSPLVCLHPATTRQ